jgi:hypothetical protein
MVLNSQSDVSAYEFFTYQLENVVPVPWSTNEEQANLLASLKDGSLAAVVLDNVSAVEGDYKNEIHVLNDEAMFNWFLCK